MQAQISPSAIAEAPLPASPLASPMEPAFLGRPFSRGDTASTLRTIVALMLREMTTRYGRSPGGYIWAVLEPLGALLVLSMGFALVMRNPPIGTSFLLYFATGNMPFTLYSRVDNAVSRSLGFSKPLLMYPSVRWIDAVLARFLLNSITSMIISFILLTGTIVMTETRTVLELGPILTAMTMAALLGMATGLVNCALTGLFPVWDMFWGMATRPLYIASGVLVMYESLPRVAQDVLWWNPLLHIVGEMRTGFYPTYNADYVSMSYVLLVTLALLALGLLLVRRHHLTILYD